ncbi:hexose transporter hxt5 [Talaromyces marneffei ATCC 18224]|uniref:MFS monosaccharide transporter, putative n=1 Tax=Talaromyces marneffei (strain ATCC 18224 / CBS 334.59 / QM 7333) TaxID=441960 RepID=B6QT05_TALMQ|nr:MFS monosaccharide transporter, putative [Talaromyces marneffei ATCC 18224]
MDSSPSSHEKVHQEHAEQSTLPNSSNGSASNSDDIVMVDLPTAIVEKGPQLLDTKVPFLTWRSVVMGLFVSMGGFIFGYDTGQISGFLQMEDFLYSFGEWNGEKYEFSDVRSGLITGLLSIGTLIGALVGAPIADRIGRKWSISFWCIILCVGVTVQISSSQGKWYQVAVGRLIAGLGVGALSLIVPMYQGESGPRHIRGALISLYQLFITLGIFVAYCIDFGTEAMTTSASWRILMGITYLWAIILGVGIIFFPESPRFDYRHGKVDRAVANLAKIYGIPQNHRALAQEFEEIKEKYEEEKSHGNITWWMMLGAPRMKYRIMVGMLLQALQQLTGANYFFYYGTTIFQGAGISNSFVTQMILGGVNFGTTFLGLYNIQHFGRRKSLIAGAIWMFVCFLIFASIGHFSLDRQTPANTPAAGKAMVCFACFFILGYASTWAPMVWAICAELYPSEFRARAMAMSTASNWLWNFLLAFFTPFITSAIDFRFGYVFAGCMFATAFVVYFAVIEGKDRTLEEIDTMYVQRVKPWESSKYVFPEGEFESAGTTASGGNGNGKDEVTQEHIN